MDIEEKVEVTKKAILEALEKAMGVVTQACKMVGVSRQTYYRYYREDLDFKNSADEINEVALDFAESKLFKKIEELDTASIIFYLKTKGKHRGFVERKEYADVTDIPPTEEEIIAELERISKASKRISS